MGVIVRVFLSVSVLLVALSSAAFPQDPPPSVRIMPLGDSITVGYLAPDTTPAPELITGYRQPLYLALQTAGYGVDFVGGERAGELAQPVFDPDHEGHGGWRDDQVAANVYAWLVAHPADIVLLHIGINSLSTSPGDVRDILDEIDRFSPETIVLLARIINYAEESPEVTAFNDNVEAMARERIAAGDRILIVDLESALDDPSYYADEKHPNAAGYERIAGGWFEALDQILDTQESAPQIRSSPVTSARVDELYVYTVTSTGYPTVTYSLVEAPAGMTIDAVSGRIEWSPEAPGVWEVTVAAANSLGSATQNYSLSAVDTTTCAAGLMAYWPLDEPAGTVYAEIVEGSNALCAAGDCPTATPGMVAGAQSFANASGLTVVADPRFDWEVEQSFTIELWLRRAAGLNGTEVLVGRNDGGTNLQWWVGIDHSKGDVAWFFLRGEAGKGNSVGGATVVTDGAWHHVAAVREAENERLRIYVDGVEEGSKRSLYDSDFASPTAAVTLGWLNRSDGYRYQGAADEIAIHDRALSAAEILASYENGLAGAPHCGSAPSPLPPEFVSEPPLTAPLGGLYVYDAEATGVPVPSYALEQAPAGMTIDRQSGRIEWLADTVGTFDVVVRAFNVAGEAAQTFTVQVDAVALAPQIVSTPPLNVILGHTYVYDVEAEGVPAPIFVLLEAPAGMFIDEASGVIEWTPLSVGSFSVTVDARNETGSDQQSFMLEISESAGGVCPEGLISYWPLDETSGSLYLDRIAGRDALCVAECPTATAGVVAGAQAFAGASGLSVAADSRFDWGVEQSFTLEFWMRRAAGLNSTEVLVGRNDGGTNLQWWVGIDHSKGDVAWFFLRGVAGKGNSVGGATVVADGAWHHVAAVRDAENERLRIYVDGVEEGSKRGLYDSDFASSTAAVTLGWLNRSDGYRYQGSVDDVALYDRALSPEEIAQHYQAGAIGSGHCAD